MTSTETCACGQHPATDYGVTCPSCTVTDIRGALQVALTNNDWPRYTDLRLTLVGRVGRDA